MPPQLFPLAGFPISGNDSARYLASQDDAIGQLTDISSLLSLCPIHQRVGRPVDKLYLRTVYQPHQPSVGS